jgi:predicted acetyltransferase
MMDANLEIRGCNTREELMKVVDLCDAAFPKTEREYFERHILKDDTLISQDTRVVLLNGEIISSVQVFPRSIYFKGKIIKIGGIGNVATLPSQRNHGYAGLLMNDAINYMKEKNLTISLLTTSINKYYEKFGFRTLNRIIAEIEIRNKTEYNEIRQFEPGKDFLKIIDLYVKYNSKSSGPIARDEKYWNSQFRFCGEDLGLFLVYEENGKIKGFVRGKKAEDKIKIWEYAASDKSNNIIQKLFENLAARTGLNKAELFLSNCEQERIHWIAINEEKKDTDLMINFIDKDIDNEIRRELLIDNNLTFWLTDFF